MRTTWSSQALGKDMVTEGSGRGQGEGGEEEKMGRRGQGRPEIVGAPSRNEAWTAGKSRYTACLLLSEF